MMNRHNIIGLMWISVSLSAPALEMNAVTSEQGPDGVSGATPVYDGDNVQTVTLEDVRWFLSGKADKQAAFVDARFEGYIGNSKLPGAVLLNTKTSEEEIARRLPDINQLVVVYCSDRTCPAGYWMAKRLVQIGYRRVVEYPGGIAEWIENGGQTEPVDESRRNESLKAKGVQAPCSGRGCSSPGNNS